MGPYPNGARSVSCETELLDTQVFSGSVNNGSDRGSDFLDKKKNPNSDPSPETFDVFAFYIKKKIIINLKKTSGDLGDLRVKDLTPIQAVTLGNPRSLEVTNNRPLKRSRFNSPSQKGHFNHP